MDNAEIERRQIEACVGALQAIRFVDGRYSGGSASNARVRELCMALAQVDEALGLEGSNLCKYVADALAKTYLGHSLK